VSRAALAWEAEGGSAGRRDIGAAALSEAGGAASRVRALITQVRLRDQP